MKSDNSDWETVEIDRLIACCFLSPAIFQPPRSGYIWRRPWLLHVPFWFTNETSIRAPYGERDWDPVVSNATASLSVTKYSTACMKLIELDSDGRLIMEFLQNQYVPRLAYSPADLTQMRVEHRVQLSNTDKCWQRTRPAVWIAHNRDPMRFTCENTTRASWLVDACDMCHNKSSMSDVVYLSSRSASKRMSNQNKSVSETIRLEQSSAECNGQANKRTGARSFLDSIAFLGSE